MRFRIAQSLPLVLITILVVSACSSPITRWEEPSQRTSSASKPRPAPRRSGGETYTVRSGDTLYSIAFRNQVDYHDLANWNGIGSDYRIMPGRVLRLSPGAETRIARAAPAPVVRPRPAPEGVSVKPAPIPVVPAPATPSQDIIASAPAPAAPPAASAPEIVANSGFEWFWPTTGTILKTYAPQSGFKGLDFGGNFGQPVFAAAPGRVVYSGNALKGYGELIIIKHNDTYLSAYSYNRTRNVKEGDVVTAGQPIGELGMGPENKPFLHFEIRERGQPVDPMRFLPKRETTPGAKLSGN
jgi:lipoprotein NlpD